MANNNVNISAIKTSNLAFASTSSFYLIKDDNQIVFNDDFDLSSSVILCHKYTGSDATSYYYKSEQLRIADLSDYILDKYRTNIIAESAGDYSGSFSGSFYHIPGAIDQIYGTSSGYFSGIANINSGNISNAYLENCTLDSNSNMTNVKITGGRGTFTGSIGDEINLTDVTYYGKALSAESADVAEYANNSEFAVKAKYAESLTNEINHVANADEATHAASATYTEKCGYAEKAESSSYASEAEVAKLANKASYAEFAGGVSLDAYPIGYCDYIRMVPLQSNINDGCNTSATNIDCSTYKWIKFKCNSDGYYTLTFDFLALRLSQYKSTAGPIPYADGTDAKGNPKQQLVYYADPNDPTARRGQSITSLLYNVSDSGIGNIVTNADKNNFGTIIQFQSAAGEAYEQKCPETIQSRNIIYNVKLEKDKEYLFVNNYFPYRPDFMTSPSLEYFPNEPAVGLYYKIANVGYGSENIIVNFLNYNNSESENFSSYMGPILEIRKVGNL